jgi:hypothetical protein
MESQVLEHPTSLKNTKFHGMTRWEIESIPDRQRLIENAVSRSVDWLKAFRSLDSLQAKIDWNAVSRSVDWLKTFRSLQMN